MVKVRVPSMSMVSPTKFKVNWGTYEIKKVVPKKRVKRVVKRKKRR